MKRRLWDIKRVVCMVCGGPTPRPHEIVFSTCRSCMEPPSIRAIEMRVKLIRDAVITFGNQKKLAIFLKVSPSAISRWASKERAVPRWVPDRLRQRKGIVE